MRSRMFAGIFFHFPLCRRCIVSGAYCEWRLLRPASLACLTAAVLFVRRKNGSGDKAQTTGMLHCFAPFFIA